MTEPDLSRMREGNSNQRFLLRSRATLKRVLRLASVMVVQWVFLMRNLLKLCADSLLWLGTKPLDIILCAVYWMSARFEPASAETYEGFEHLRQTLWSGAKVGTGGRLTTLLVPPEADEAIASGYVDNKAPSPLAVSASAVYESIDEILTTARQAVDPIDTDLDLDRLEILPRDEQTESQRARRRQRMWRMRRRKAITTEPGLKPLRISSQPRGMRPRARRGLRIRFDWHRPRASPLHTPDST